MGHLNTLAAAWGSGNDLFSHFKKDFQELMINHVGWG